LFRIRAGRVHPVTAPPIEDGAVLVGDDGRITAVGPHPHVPTPARAEVLEFPDAVVTPGLVNTHTHLELTHMGGRHTEPVFAKWISRLRAKKEATAPDAFYAAAVAGVKDCWARGVTCVGETGSTGAVMRALHDLRGRGVVYHEVFGPDPETVDASVAELRRSVAELRPLETALLRFGISPHAPYSVSAPLYRAYVELAARERLPLAVHIAESKEETEFVRDAAGPFAELHRQWGIPVAVLGRSPVQYLAELGVLGPGTLCIHCVQVDADDVRAMLAGRVAVAHCPVSNRAHGHGTAPFATLRASGLRVGLGTDSIVSVGELDLWAEARAAGLEGEDAIRMLTIEGARALGWEHEIGSLEVGKAGDLAVLTVQPSNGPTVHLTVLAGRIVHEAGSQRAH
jgi:5-methylthioadenosine/S-adenosylhomocysteine deaminase